MLIAHFYNLILDVIYKKRQRRLLSEFVWKPLLLNLNKVCQSHSLFENFTEHFPWSFTYKTLFLWSFDYLLTHFITSQMSSFKMNASLLMPSLGPFEKKTIMSLLCRKSVQVLISLLDINNDYIITRAVIYAVFIIDHQNKQMMVFNVPNVWNSI